MSFLKSISIQVGLIALIVFALFSGHLLRAFFIWLNR